MGHVVGLLSVLHLWLMGNKWRYAPLSGVMLQLAWGWYAWSHDKALLPSVTAILVVNIRNTILWQMKKIR